MSGEEEADEGCEPDILREGYSDIWVGQCTSTPPPTPKVARSSEEEAEEQRKLASLREGVHTLIFMDSDFDIHS